MNTNLRSRLRRIITPEPKPFVAWVINDLTREQKPMEETRARFRIQEAHPKAGDLIEVRVGGFSGSTCYYLPARVTHADHRATLYIDLTDFHMDCLKDLRDKYLWLTTGNSTTATEVAITADGRASKEEGIDYELLLLEGQQEIDRKGMGFKDKADPRYELHHYIPGLAPFSQIRNGDKELDTIGGLTRSQVIVEAVLHPLFGLPKVLVKIRE